MITIRKKVGELLWVLAALDCYDALAHCERLAAKLGVLDPIEGQPESVARAESLMNEILDGMWHEHMGREYMMLGNAVWFKIADCAVDL